MPMRLEDLSSPIVAVAEPETSALVAAQLMRQHHVGALVVVDKMGRPTGIATMEDVLELLARELTALTQGLRGARDREFEQRR